MSFLVSAVFSLTENVAVPRLVRWAPYQLREVVTHRSSLQEAGMARPAAAMTGDLPVGRSPRQPALLSNRGDRTRCSLRRRRALGRLDRPRPEARTNLQTGSPAVRLAMPCDGLRATQQHRVGRMLIANRLHTLPPLIRVGIAGQNQRASPDCGGRPDEVRIRRSGRGCRPDTSSECSRGDCHRK